MAVLNIDFSRVEASTGVQPALPTGWQNCVVEESEHKPTANNATTGNELISIKVKVLDGPYANRVAFKTFNFKNSNQQAQDIGWGEMKALNDALGIAQPLDTVEWHMKPVKIHFKYKPARTLPDDPNTGAPGKTYDEGNDINGFKNINDTSVEVNHNVSVRSGGSSVTVAPSFAQGGSPVPQVGAQASSSLAAVMAAAQAPVVAAAEPVIAAQPAPAAAVIPQAAAVIHAAVVPVVKQYRMTGKLPNVTAEQFRATDPAWTDEKLIQEGYMEEVPNVPAIPTTPAVPSVAVPTAAATTPANSTAGADVPPWLAGK